MNPNDQNDQTANWERPHDSWQQPPGSLESAQQPSASLNTPQPAPAQTSGQTEPTVLSSDQRPQPPQQTQQPVSPRPIQKDQTGAYSVVPPLQNQGQSGHNPYEFIMASNSPQPRPPLQRLSLAKKIIIGVVGLIVIFSLVALGKKLFIRPDPTIASMVAIAQEQKEVMRVAAKYTTARAENVRAFAINTQNIVGTDYQAVTEYLKKRKALPKPEVLALKQDAKTDTILKDSTANNTYDDTLLKTLYAQLSDYQTNLGNTYKTIDGKNAKALLEKSYTNVQLLRTQSGIVDPAQPPQ